MKAFQVKEEPSILAVISDFLFHAKETSQGLEVKRADNDRIIAKQDSSKNEIISELKNSQNFSNREFLSAICHEIKNPLNAIVNFSSILQMEIRNPESKEECLDYVKEIKQAALDLNELIHDLLDVGQACSGNFSVDVSKDVDVKNVIKRSVKLNCDYAIARGISLKVEVANDVCLMRLDERRMKQILVNLISNAVKYSPENSAVTISAKNITAKNSQKYLEIIVSDQGFGMTKEEVELAFQKYQTIQNPNSGKVDSFGLGLPITKQLVELQSGVIEAVSEVGKGTQMILKFPYLMQ